VAVKVLHSHWLADPVARARLAKEVAAAQRVAPFCTAAIVDAQLEHDPPFVVSEFIAGLSLAQQVAARVRLSRRLAAQAASFLLVGLAIALAAFALFSRPGNPAAMRGTTAGSPGHSPAATPAPSRSASSPATTPSARPKATHAPAGAGARPASPASGSSPGGSSGNSISSVVSSLSRTIKQAGL
jgi:hypothetical protein